MDRGAWWATVHGVAKFLKVCAMLLWQKHFPMEKHHSKQIIWDHVARIVFYTSNSTAVFPQQTLCYS